MASPWASFSGLIVTASNIRIMQPITYNSMKDHFSIQKLTNVYVNNSMQL
jgi:hypothetical protein